MRLEITLTDASIIYTALTHYRKTVLWNARSVNATAEEKTEAQKILIRIDKLLIQWKDDYEKQCPYCFQFGHDLAGCRLHFEATHKSKLEGDVGLEWDQRRLEEEA